MFVKILRGTPKHLSRSGTLQGFTYLMLTLPFQCNYRCPKCFNLSNNIPITSGLPLEKETILEAIEEAHGLGGTVVVVAGEGEPTLHPFIKDIVNLTSTLGMILVVYSNGSTLSRKYTEYYFENNVSLVIALDSLDDKTYDFLTGTKNMLPLVLKNISQLRKLYRKAVEYKEDMKIVRLAVNATITSQNKHEISKIKEYCEDDIYFVCNPLARHGNAVGNWNQLIESEEDFELQRQMIPNLSESGGPLTLDKVGLCGYSVNGIGIGSYGDFMTCAYTSKTNGLLGNIRDISIADAYHRKFSFESEHYKNIGHLPCLVRDKSFDQYIETLKEKTIDVELLTNHRSVHC